MPASIKHTPSRPSAPWRVYFRGKTIWCKTEELAKKKATELDGGKAAATMSLREVDEYRYAKELLQGVPLLQAVRQFLEHQSGEKPVTVANAVEQHLESATGRPDYLEKKRYFLGKLSEALGTKRLGAVAPTDIEALSKKLSESDWMRNTFLKHVRILFRWCIKMRMTRNDPTHGIADRKVEPTKVILSLPDVEHLLTTCASATPEILRAIALQLFTGIRTSEVCRLEWPAVRVGEFVDIAPQVAKTGERRVIDWWPPRLTPYLGQPRTSGTFLDTPRSYEHRKWELVRICKATKPDFGWGQNAPRHSFASYAVAYWQDAGRVALLMGQRDVNVLFRHYRNYRTQAEGAAYFGLTL